MASFPFFKQLDAMDCGPSCIRMIAKHYGKSFTLQTLREKSYYSRDGVSLLGISDAAEAIGFRSIGVSLTLKQILNEAPKPLILHWRQNHFVVLHKVRKNNVFIADPALGLIKYTIEEFSKHWLTKKEGGEEKGLALLLEPTPEFYAHEGEKVNRAGFGFLLKYIKPYRRFVYQLVIGMIAASLLQLIFPFLTQAIVDFWY
jgi:ATP-binding cassette subfamily B protein